MAEDGHPEAEAGLAEDNVNLEQMLDLATPWCLRVAATMRIPGTGNPIGLAGHAVPR